MASDLSNIIKDELSNTLESLLSKSTKVIDTKAVESSDYSEEQCIKVDVKFDFKGISSSWSFFIPTAAATKFEYFMLGGMGDLKDHIDDEIADAVNEIVSNVCGSISTAVNAQGFDDLGNVKFESIGNIIVECSTLEELSNAYQFNLSMDEEKVATIISFDEVILPFIASISGINSTGTAPVSDTAVAALGVSMPTIEDTSGILSLLGEDSIDNLKLLFNIKLKLSVRLGTKIFLLKDILRWDIGEIIELEQMVNEPLDILVNGVKVGEGEAVIVEGKFGLKIRSIGDVKNRLNQVSLGR